MKINFAQKNISFSKTLIATGAYLDKGKSEPCNFYKLDNIEDSKLVNEIFDTNEWKGSELLSAFLCNFVAEEWKFDEFYIAENKKGECLAISEVYDASIDGKEGKGIYILETSPNLCANNKDRKTKYIGETFLAFITKLSKKINGDVVDIPNAYDNAVPFYVDKCFFETAGISDGEYTPITLYSENFNNLISQNEEHTKKQIWFV